MLGGREEPRRLAGFMRFMGFRASVKREVGRLDNVSVETAAGTPATERVRGQVSQLKSQVGKR